MSVLPWDFMSSFLRLSRTTIEITVTLGKKDLLLAGSPLHASVSSWPQDRYAALKKANR